MVEDPFSEYAQVFGKIYQERLILLKFLQI